MAQFTDDLSEFFDPDLYLPIRGNLYRIPEPSAKVALRIQQVAARGGFLADEEKRQAMELLGATWVADAETVKIPVTVDGRQQFDETGRELYVEETIGRWEGGVYQEMVDAGIGLDEIEHAGVTAVVKAAFGLDRAEEYWQTRLAETPAAEIAAVEAPGVAGKVTPPAQPGGAVKSPAVKKTPPRKAMKKTAPRKVAKKTAPRKAPAKRPS